MAHSSRRWSFDIETSISTWRQFASRNRSLSSEDLEELESHIRDTWEALVAEGVSDEDAFRMALRDIGDLSSLERWFGEVAREKRLEKTGIGGELRSRLALAGNYVKAATRSISRHRTIAALNIFGLAIGLAAVVLIGAYIAHSLSYDRYHPEADRIVRVIQHIETMPEDQWLSGSPFRMLYVVDELFNGADLVTSVAGFDYAERPFTVGDVDQMVDGVIHTDQNFLDMFSVDIIEKSTEAPLSTQGSMVVTRSLARRLFGSDSPLGRTVRYNASTDYTVEAVVEDPPANTHLPFNALLRSRSSIDRTDWRYDGRVYARLAVGTDPSDLVSFLSDTIPELRGSSMPEQEYRVERLTDIHLHSTAVDQYATVSDVRYLWIFGAVGALIALLAGINYTNMATAQSLRRAREVGIRKVVGANRAQLQRQVVLESAATTFAAIPIAAVLVLLALPRFQLISGETITTGIMWNPTFLGAVAFAGLLLAVGSGWYPAVVLARLSPGSVLAGRGSSLVRPRMLRHLLVGFQVTISFGMIASTLVINRQMAFVRTINLGFDQDLVVTVNTPRWSHDKVDAFRAELSGSPAVAAVAAGIPPGINWRSSSGRRAFRPDGEEIPFTIVHVGPGFFEAMDIDVLEGREFRPEDLKQDPPPVVVSESWKRHSSGVDPVVGSPSGISFGWEGGEIVGISEDILNESLLEESTIVAFILNPESLGINRVVARLRDGQIGGGLAALRAAFESIEPEGVFAFEFLDQQIQRQYATQTRLAHAFDLFAGVSIFVALLGLFGLATLTARQRVREIGIRKVLGASVSGIVFLLSKDVVKLMLIGALLTIPPVVLFGNRWLNNFSRHVTIGPDLFLLSGALVLTLVLLAVGIQSYRAAIANPVDCIRHE